MDIIWKESSGKTQDNGTRGCRGLCCYPTRPCCSSLSEALLVPFHTTNSAWISLLPSLCFCLLLLSLLSYPIFPLEHIHTSIPISPPFLPCSLSPCILPSFPVKFLLAFPQAVFFLALPLKGTLIFCFFFGALNLAGFLQMFMNAKEWSTVQTKLEAHGSIPQRF